MGPESSRRTNPEAEKTEVMHQLGIKLYGHCLFLFTKLERRPIKGGVPGVDDGMYSNPLIREFSMGPGEVVDFDNPKGLGCSIVKKPGSKNILFEYSDTSHEGSGDWVDRYLLDENGNILATEHRETDTDHEVGNAEDYKFSPLPINPEELLYKIDHEFVTATTEES